MMYIRQLIPLKTTRLTIVYQQNITWNRSCLPLFSPPTCHLYANPIGNVSYVHVCPTMLTVIGWPFRFITQLYRAIHTLFPVYDVMTKRSLSQVINLLILLPHIAVLLHIDEQWFVVFSGCHYIKGEWGGCDSLTNQKSRTDRLESGEGCEATRVKTKQCRSRSV